VSQFGSSQVRSGLIKIFLQIVIWVDFWRSSPRTRFTWVEPVVSRIGSPTRK